MDHLNPANRGNADDNTPARNEAFSSCFDSICCTPEVQGEDALPLLWCLIPRLDRPAASYVAYEDVKTPEGGDGFRDDALRS